MCNCFFFQAEDGIRDIGVTGVQTCALPIYANREPSRHRSVWADDQEQRAGAPRRDGRDPWLSFRVRGDRDRKSVVSGKSVDLGGRRIIKKKPTESFITKRRLQRSVAQTVRV